ncbi:MAG TPA: hypothetical protein VFY56_13825, partial [Propionibacteriaceae bacterium]|nr:hypothetical protein [Propionibacteriaceae bacterium]
AEGSRWMDGLLTSVILLEKAKLTLQVKGIQGFQKAHAAALPRSCSLPLIYCPFAETECHAVHASCKSRVSHGSVD